MESERALSAAPERAPAPAVSRSRPSVAAGPVGPRALSPALLCALQSGVGNAAVQRLLTGDPIVSRQVPPVYTAPTPGGGPPPGPPPGPVIPTVVLNGSTPVEKAADGFTRGTPDTVDEAWRLLFSRAMYDLLPLLAGLKAKGLWPAITGSGGPRGGPRMITAVLAVDLHTKGSPITKDELRDLIDKMATLDPYQRADVLRFVGKYVVLTVDGIDLDYSYLAGTSSRSAVTEVQNELDQAKFFIKEYTAAGALPGVTTGAQVDDAVKASMVKQGMTPVVAGSTSSSGAITIATTTMNKAQPILTRATELHEGVHSHHVADLQKQYGAGYKKVFNDAADYVKDEINCRRTEIAFFTKVLAALQQLEKMVK